MEESDGSPCHVSPTIITTESLSFDFRGLVLHQIVSSQIAAYRSRTSKLNEEVKLQRDITAKSKLGKLPNAWVSAEIGR